MFICLGLDETRTMQVKAHATLPVTMALSMPLREMPDFTADYELLCATFARLSKVLSAHFLRW
jgi:hypothetical protein